MSASPAPTPAMTQADQLRTLRELIAALLKSNPFYSRKLREAGVTADIDSLDAFTARLPFTSKQQLVEDQSAHAPFGTNLTYELSRYTRYHQTSGTTRTPIRWLDTPESWSWMLDNWARVYAAAGVDATSRVYFAFSFGPFLGFWTAFDAAQRLGCLCIPGGGLHSAARLGAIIDNHATVLCCTPTYALRLAEVAAEEGIDLTTSKVRTIIVAGEPGASIPATRARMRKLWNGARIVDHHGMTEVGPVSYECPKREGVLHVIESAYLAEVIDPVTGHQVARGAAGELVLTTLGRHGSPLLRYRTGDLVQPGAPGVCACGSSDLALEGGILSRVDDMVVVRSVNVYPSAVEEVVRSCDGVAEYQVEVSTARAMAELKVIIEPAPDCGDAKALASRLASALHTALSLRVPVQTVPTGALPRYEMKARRWVRKG